MRRFAILMLAACSGGSSNVSGTLGSTHDTTHPAAPAPVAQHDPAGLARRAFSNPGGMWQPQQLALPGHVEAFQRLGVTLDAKQLADPLAAPLAAVVSLGGCTGSFVSPDGLIVTNHHCVQLALKLNSTKDKNLVETGFLAKTRAEEISAGPAARVQVLQAFRDVSKEMREGLETIADPVARQLEIEKRGKQLIAACEKDRPGIRCSVSSFFRGDQYTLLENLELRDVRLVYATPRPIGNFGGEIDNWAWPRHTADFAFLRAYKDNAPFHPKHYLKVATDGVKPFDFVMVTGYPGSTNRLRTVQEVRHLVEWSLPYTLAHLKERYAIAAGLVKTGEGETAIKAAVSQRSTQNRLENIEGQLEGLTRGELLARKGTVERQVREWATKPGRDAELGALTKLDALVLEQQRTARADYDRTAAFVGSSLLAHGISLVRWAEERRKPDAERKLGYQDRDLANAAARHVQFLRDYDRTLDRALFRLALVRALQLPESERAWLPVLLGAARGAKLDEKAIDRTLDTWYRTQLLEDEKLRLALLTKGTPAQLRQSKDPFLQAALRVWPTYLAAEKRDDARDGDLAVLAPPYAAMTREVLGGLLAPDANGTLRITYGTVRSLRPESADPADRAITVASEIPAKVTGAKPFDLPATVVDGIQHRTFGPYADAARELPVNFVADLDTTGGNSGSPVLNGRGELVGLAFDGMKSGVASAVVFDGSTTRSIAIDVRYLLWVTDFVDGADALITELGLRPSLP
jgi:hypothetical protein